MINNPASILIPIFDTCIHDEKELTANVAAVICKANGERKYAAFINNSQIEILLVLSELNKVTLNKGLLLKPGGSYEINFNNLYVGAVCAVSKFTCKLSFVECVE
ncbi:hypothetical protein [Nostoc sp.]|uniref:hypothetical protein n=1 Tax=Nostoc sp. TaxID=1180 RepID=UPI002FFA4C4D